MSNHYVFNAEPDELPIIIKSGKKLTEFIFNVMIGRDNPSDEGSTDEAIHFLKLYLDMLEILESMQKDFELMNK